MRAVTTDTAAAVLGVSRRQLDNTLSRIGSAALDTGRQGVARRIPIHRLPVLFLALELTARTGLPVRRAYQVAAALAAGAFVPGPFLRLEMDLEGVRRTIDQRLAVAIETTVTPVRGRPRRTLSRAG